MNPPTRTGIGTHKQFSEEDKRATTKMKKWFGPFLFSSLLFSLSVFELKPLSFRKKFRRENSEKCVKILELASA